jgi:exosome complex component RRP41
MYSKNHLKEKSVQEVNQFILLVNSSSGTRCAAINAACLALIDAGIPMYDFVSSCAAGMVASTPILGKNEITTPIAN